MDDYIVRLSCKGNNSPIVKFVEETGVFQDSEESLPCVEYILRTRKSVKYGATFEITPEEQEKDNVITSHWNRLTFEDKELIDDNNLHSTDSKNASELLLQLSDRLPMPGSYMLHIYWDIRGLKIAENLRSHAPLLGALRKLCVWHQGHLTVFTNDERNNERLKSIIDFVDELSDIEKITGDQPAAVFLDKMYWRGSLEVLHKGTPLHSLPGFTLSRHVFQLEPKITVNHKNETSNDFHTNNDSFTEEERDNVWFEPKINMIEYIDVSTVPLYLFSGRRFVLRYHINENFPGCQKNVERLRDLVNSRYVGALLCSLDYFVSASEFESIPEYSSKKWQDAIMKMPECTSAPKYKLCHQLRTLHLLLVQSDIDRSISEVHGTKIIQFSAHLLHRVEEINLVPLLKSEIDRATKKSFENVNELDMNGITVLNPAGFLYKDENFNLQISQAITNWTETNQTMSMPTDELRTLLKETSMQLNTEQEKVFHDLTNVHFESPISHNHPDGDELHEMELDSLRNRDRIQNEMECANKMKSVKSGDSLLSAASTKSVLDMHLKPFDVLQHFSSSGRPIRESLIDTERRTEDMDFPSPRKLRDFNDSLKLSYHGITYNIDERSAEKRDRMCRRLVEKQVKYETSSIGSFEKVPSPATLNIADSPVRRSSLAADSDGKVTGSQKRIQLQKVAEKIYKKRIRSRSNMPSTSGRSTMVLRSTPTKSRTESAVLKAGMGLRSSSVSETKEKLEVAASKGNIAEEEKRAKRRTYVQDNKKRLLDLITRSLIENGVSKENKQFNTCSKRLYNVSMAFLKDLKSSKDLDKIMKETVANNVKSVIMFNAK